MKGKGADGNNSGSDNYDEYVSNIIHAPKETFDLEQINNDIDAEETRIHSFEVEDQGGLDTQKRGRTRPVNNLEAAQDMNNSDN